jgi:hypothetical protein
MLHVFGYLKKYPHGKILVDPAFPDHSQYSPVEQNWSEFYPKAYKELQPDMPTPKGKAARTTCYVDAVHAHDVVTRRSISGVLLFFNNMTVK